MGYDLRSSAESSTDNMAHKGVLLVALGIRYKGYCANLGRSFIVDPSKVSQIDEVMSKTLMWRC